MYCQSNVLNVIGFFFFIYSRRIYARNCEKNNIMGKYDFSFIENQIILQTKIERSVIKNGYKWISC